jgi:hypothetical protein
LDVDLVLSRLCEALGLADQSALALALQKDETTFRVWRSRKRIPSSVLMEVVARSGRSLHWLTEGQSDVTEKNGRSEVNEPSSFYVAKSEKQVNQFTADEEALIMEFRQAPPKVRQALITLVRHAARKVTPASE